MATATEVPRDRLRELARYFLRLGVLGFGGPVALVGVLSLAVLFRWKINNPLLIAVTAAVGLVAFPLLHPTWVMVK